MKLATLPIVILGLGAALVLSAPQPVRAQQPSPALATKSADAQALLARAANGPVRIVVHHRRPTGPGYAGLGTAREDIQSVVRENQTEHQGIIASHFPAGSLNSPNRALRMMAVTPAFAITATTAEIEALANDSRVLHIALDQVRQPVLIQSVPLIGMTNAYSTYGATGTGWAVAIIDSGVDKTHTFLANVIMEACFSTTTGTLGSGGSASTCPGGAHSSSAAGSGVNCNISWAGCEHGTHVAGIAAGFNTQFQSGQPPNGVAKSSGIIAIKAASEFTGSDCGSGPSPCILFWDSDMQAGLDYVFTIRNSLPAGYQGVAAANMSIGGSLFSSACDSSFPSFKTSIDNLLSANIATVVAAGNSGSKSQISFPACISSAIAVSASSKSDVIASYTNINSQVAVFAPGGDFTSSTSIILSSVPAGYTACASDGFAFPGPNPSTGGTYCYLAGTSMATPHVTGAFAAIKSAVPAATVAQILSALKSTGLSIADTRSGGTITKPRIRVDQALQALGASTNTLQVSPATNISSSGNAAGPFAPTSFPYQLSASNGSIGYSITGLPSWLSASSTSGTLTTTATTVTFTINASANSLAAGPYSATINFTNTTNGLGNTSRSATLTVNSTNGSPGGTWHSYVSASSGTNSGNCTNINTPCSTLGFAMNSVPFTGGEVSLTGGGDFSPFTITKSVTIEAIDVPARIVGDNSQAAAIVINAGPLDTVVLKNLEITGGATGAAGIQVNTAGKVVIINCTLRGFSVSPGNAIQFVPANGGGQAHLYVSNTEVSDGIGALISVRPADTTWAKAYFDEVQVHNGLSGIVSDGANGPVSTAIKKSAFFSFNGSGITATTPGSNAVKVTYDKGTIHNSGGSAINASGSASIIALFKDVIVGSQTGVAASSGGIVNLDNNVITANGIGVSTAGGTVNSAGNNMIIWNGTDVSGALSAGVPLQ